MLVKDVPDTTDTFRMWKVGPRISHTSCLQERFKVFWGKKGPRGTRQRNHVKRPLHTQCKLTLAIKVK